MVKENVEKTFKLPIIKIYSEFPITFFGGGERLIVKIYNHLKGNNFEVKIIENNAKLAESRVTKREVTDVIKQDLISVPFKTYGFPKFFYQQLPKIEDLLDTQKNISLIFARRLPPKFVMNKLLKSESKFIFCLHGIALENFRFTNLKIMVHQIVIRHQLRILSKYVQRNIFVQCLTPHIREYLLNNGASDKNIFLIENEYLAETVEIIPNNNSFDVIFIGRMQNNTKGIRFLKDVIKRVKKREPSINFTVIGIGPDLKILDDVREKANILGRVDDEDKKQYLLHSNLGIITSNLEPYSLVAMEFLSAGLPVVTTPVSGPMNILKKNKLFGKISSFNAESFSNDIIYYYDKWKRDKLSYFLERKEIANLAKSIFNEGNMLDSYLIMVRQVISRDSSQL